MSTVIDLAQDALISLEQAVDDLSGKYRDRFGYGDSIRAVPFVGFANGTAVTVSGRVLSDQRVEGDAGDSTVRNLLHMLERYKTDEVADARLRLTINGESFDVQTDSEGYFDEALELERPLDPANGLVQTYDIELLEPMSRNEQYETHFTGEIQVPTNARLGIISDIDDTIVRTGATNFFRHLETVIVNNAHTRVPFRGVAPFYAALRDEQGSPANPLFYVSSSPTNLYELFVDFMRAANIPGGTIFLKDFGFSEGKFLKTGHNHYKRDRIERILDAYPHMSFILVGDSGQKDAEIYRDVAEDFADRLLAIYIRDVTDDGREDEVRAIARDVAALGVPMLLMETTERAAEHAASQGWITPDELDRVREHIEHPELDAREPGLVGEKR